MKFIFTASLLFFLLGNTLGQSQVDYFKYTVKKQDKSLWNICQRFQTTVPTVQALNHRKDDLIKVGDVLHIPNNGNFIVHTVSSKDISLYNISKMHQVPWLAIQQLNGKKNETIYPNEMLIIPIHLSPSNVIKKLIANSNVKKTFKLHNKTVQVINSVKGNIDILTIAIDNEIKLQDTFNHNVFATLSTDFSDYNQDGFPDITFSHMDLRSISLIYLYDPKQQTFRLIKNIANFPESKRWKNTNLYYSYEARGCANSIWESCLFTIQNFEAIPLARLHVDNCDYNIVTFFKYNNPDQKITLSKKEFPFEYTYYKSGKKLMIKSKYMEMIWGSRLNNFE